MAASLEILRSDLPRGRFRAVLFDFDGTLSLIREDWPQVMIPMMVDVLAATGTPETREELAAHVEEFVMRLNGRQTIYQMIQLADEVRPAAAGRWSRWPTSTLPRPAHGRRSRAASPGCATAGIGRRSGPCPAVTPCSSACAAGVWRCTWPAAPT